MFDLRLKSHERPCCAQDYEKQASNKPNDQMNFYYWRKAVIGHGDVLRCVGLLFQVINFFTVHAGVPQVSILRPGIFHPSRSRRRYRVSPVEAEPVCLARASSTAAWAAARRAVSNRNGEQET